MLFTRLGFFPKVYTRASVSWPIFVPAIHNQTDRALRRLCVKEYRQNGTAQLFVAYGGQVKGKPISKQKTLQMVG